MHAISSRSFPMQRRIERGSPSLFLQARAEPVSPRSPKPEWPAAWISREAPEDVVLPRWTPTLSSLAERPIEHLVLCLGWRVWVFSCGGLPAGRHVRNGPLSFI